MDNLDELDEMSTDDEVIDDECLDEDSGTEADDTNQRSRGKHYSLLIIYLLIGL